MERKGKRARPRNRWTDEVKEDLKKVGLRIWFAVARDLKKRRMIVLEAKVLTECSA
jgi:hypothetical protein